MMSPGLPGSVSTLRAMASIARLPAEEKTSPSDWSLGHSSKMTRSTSEGTFCTRQRSAKAAWQSVRGA